VTGRARPARREGSPRPLWRRLTSSTRDDRGDPAEPWETAVSAEQAARIGSPGVRGRPHRPARFDEVPAGAADALEEVCGDLSLHQLFVVPRTARWTDPSGKRCVATPTEVVALGDRVVAMWVDDPAGARVRVVVPVGRLAAIVKRNVLLYGRVAFVGAEVSLVIRYNTVAEPDLRNSLLAVRTAMAGPPVPTPAAFHWPGHPTLERGREAALPYKWRVVLGSGEVNLVRGEPATVAVGGIEDSRARRPGLAVLGSREFVIVTDPTEDVEDARYGFDVCTVPRSCLRSLAWDGGMLTVVAAPDTTAGLGPVEAHPEPILVPLDRRLGEAMRDAFAGQVRWD